MTELENFIDTGIHHFQSPVNKEKSLTLLEKAYKTRSFGPDIFIDEADFKVNPQYKGVNPIPGRNLAETLASDTLYIDQDTNVIETLSAVLGADYQIMDKKFVCGVPIEWMLEWVSEAIAESGVKNLGPYIKPEYRDITYFSGIDFHQDIIDWPELGPNFITMYVYLDDVGINDAPLHLLPKTHLHGATKFPHKLEPVTDSSWQYGDDSTDFGIFEHVVLTGKCGDVSLWHPFILHGTQPDANSTPRISLRYLIKVNESNDTSDNGLSQANDIIQGKLSLSSTRIDLNNDGEAVIRINPINKIKY